MLEKYKPLIYTTKSVQEKVKNECLDFVFYNHPKIPKEEIIEAIFNSNVPNEYEEDYCLYLFTLEGELLFEKIADKYGYKLWNGKAWRNKTCRRNCPLGRACRKQLVQIDEEYFCYGQLYTKRLNESGLFKMAKSQKHIIKLIDSDGNVEVNLTEALAKDDAFQTQYFSVWLCKFQDYIMWFGEGQKVKGRTFIERYIKEMGDFNCYG